MQLRGRSARHRALSLQRLAVVRGPEVVEYLNRYLLSEVVFEPYSAGWVPVSEAQCAADTLAEILAGFPAGGLAEQRAWLEDQTELVFRPPGNDRPFPGIR